MVIVGKNKLKSVDFGLAKQLSVDDLSTFAAQKSTTFQGKGTLRYMSPEMKALFMGGNKEKIKTSVINIYNFGRLSDAYSIGLVLYDSY